MFQILYLLDGLLFCLFVIALHIEASVNLRFYVFPLCFLFVHTKWIMIACVFKVTEYTLFHMCTRCYAEFAGFADCVYILKEIGLERCECTSCQSPYVATILDATHTTD